MKIALLGGGSWGTALAIHLAKNNHHTEIKIWEFFKEQADEMQQKRFCKLLPEVKLPTNIFVSSKMEEVLPESDLIFMVVPSDKVEITIKQARSLLKNQPIILCSKGFAADLCLLSEVIKEYVSGEVYGLYGPTHAEEVCKGMFSGIVLAGGEGKEKFKEIIESENLKVTLSNDLIGVQVASALKNVAAVFVGILDGLNLGDNAKAYIMTKCLHEIKEIGLKWGAQEDTFFGLAGMGDLIVTCISKHSRNRHVGEEIGKGRKLNEVLAEMSMVAEGVTTIKLAVQLKERFGLKLPAILGLHQILFEDKDPLTVLKKLEH